MRSLEVQILRSACELGTGPLLGDEAEAVLKGMLILPAWLMIIRF